MSWAIHLCNSTGKLDAYADRIHEAIGSVQSKTETIIPALQLDVVVQVIKNGVIPELGLVGHTLTGDLTYLTLDPDNENLAANMGEVLERMIAHEVHHALRFGALGYGKTLGEALVSEGLAGHFSRQLYGNAPEPWEAPVAEDLTFLEALDTDWANQQYDHRSWFYGLGNYPKWLGYRLGYRLVQTYLDRHPTESAASLAAANAEDFRPVLKDLAA